MTIRQCYETWGNKPEWKRLAAASLQAMVPCILRHHGSTDIEDVSDFSLQLWLASSEQPIDRKVKSRACMEHMLRWAENEGLYHNDVLNPQTETQNIEELIDMTPKDREDPPPSVQKKDIVKQKRKPTIQKKEVATQKQPKISETPPKKEIVSKPLARPKKCHSSIKADSVEDYADINGLITSEKSCGAKSRGTIYYDCGSKGDTRGGMIRRKGCWRAEITINKIRYRHRGSSSEDCEQWLEALKTGKIKPTDNKADWFRMEQHKDDNIRIDEIVLSNRTLTASRQAVALLLTRIIAGKPAINFTSTCKRMLRVYKKRGDFFYYEKAPEQVKILVNGINFDKLSEVWKVTRDRRL